MAPDLKDITTSDQQVFKGIAVTGQWISRLVEKLCGDDKYKLLLVSKNTLAEDQGYCSIIAKLYLQWSATDEKTDLPRSVILKMPTLTKLEELSFKDGATKEQRQTMHNLLVSEHRNECMCYSLFNGPWKSLSIPHPTVYGMSDPNDLNIVPYLLMEDLSEKGRCPDFVDGLTLKQCESVVESIASLHAFCYTNPDWNEGKKFNNAKQVDWTPFRELFSGQLKSLDECYPDIFADIGTTKAELEKFFEIDTIFNDVFAQKNEVLVHSDLWVNNLLFGYPKSNNPRETTDELVAILDWQLVYTGFCTADLGRLFICNLDSKLRRENEDNLLEHYYNCLRAKLPPHTEPPLRLEEVKRLYYKQTFRFYALFLTCQSPLFLAQMDKEKYTAEEYQNFIKRIQAAIQDARIHST